MPNSPNPPSFNIQIGDKKHDEDNVPLDQRMDTRIEPGMSEEEINTRIRRRIALRVKQRNEFYTHLVSFVAVNLMLWGIWLVTGASFPWPMFVTLGWGIGLFAHASQIYQNSASVSARRERTVQHEIELEKARLGLSGYDYEKPKRIYRDSLSPEQGSPSSDDQGNAASAPVQAQRQPSASQRVRLSDDGELVPVDDDIDNDTLNRPGQATRARNDRDA
jgi:hypothetical protein